ncbi:MCE family protein [Nocardia wallacei]|uniref:MCE family protein n=1 Tax=Nocardia wallacei TaxID=480035 RepID=UPI002455F87C|nr:MCE family protein [Nocardia wallacei]
MKKPFLERDPLRLGIVGTLVLVALLAAVFNYEALRGLVHSSTYHAQFGDASGLLTGSDVQIAGVPVGKVRTITLDGDKVDVEFDAEPGKVRLTAGATATIKVNTLLGHRYVELAPGNDQATLHPGDTIPRERTSSGYDITRSLEETGDTVTRTDTVDLSAALDQLSAVEENLPPDLQTQLSGLSRLSRTVASRDQALRDLLTHANGVSGVLADRSTQVSALLDQGQSLFAALNSRSAAIARILVKARVIADELTALKRDNQETLGPTLTQLETLIDTLNNNSDQINAALTGLESYAKQIGEVVGSGPYFGAMLQNILPANLAGQLPGAVGGPR